MASMMFDMESDNEDCEPSSPADSRPMFANSPIMLPSVTLSRPGSRLASPRSDSPGLFVPMRRKPSVSAGVVEMLESHLGADGGPLVVDDVGDDIESHVSVEVPIEHVYISDKVPTSDDEEESQDSGHLSNAQAGDAEGGAGPIAGSVPRADGREKKKVSIDDFDVLTMIGKGGYGKVYLVRHKKTQRHFAMKVLRKASILLRKRQITFTMTERSILSEVEHPFIVKLYYAFQSDSKLYLIMEYVSGGELFTHMANERIFTEDQAVFYTAELVLALSHLHRLGIIFRDAKPENCLLNDSGHLILTDFGLSKTALGADGRTSTFCGTPSYMAPEILSSSVSYDNSVDWWSVGVLLYEMLTGTVPFKGRSPAQISKNISKMKVVYPAFMTPDAKDLIIRLLRKKPAQRIGFGAHGVEKIKKHRFFRTIDWKRLERSYADFTPPIVPVVSGEGDVSNFDAEFTRQEIPPSVVHGSLVDDDPLPDAAALGGCGGEEEEEEVLSVDPDTAFQGFSYVATSVLHTI